MSVIHCPKSLTGRRFHQPLHYIDEDPFSIVPTGVAGATIIEGFPILESRTPGYHEKKKRKIWGYDRL